MKRALITGITGQDGSYLAEYLIARGYAVYGLVRRDGTTVRPLRSLADSLHLLYGDMRDEVSLDAVFRKSWPDELYNLAGQVFVPASWEYPAETFDVNVGGLARLLKIVARDKPDTRVYQASSSEMFGNFDGLCNESTPMRPTSPYGASKLAAHRLVKVHRDSGLFVVSGILFNHESPRRGPEMVTRKISLAAAAWAHGDGTKLRLGNLQARRDWGFAGDYVRAMHSMLQRPEPRDYIIATGVSHSVAEFLLGALQELGLIRPGDPQDAMLRFVEPDPHLLRRGEIHDLRGDASAARAELGWEPTVGFEKLVRMMVQSDVRQWQARGQQSCQRAAAAAGGDRILMSVRDALNQRQ